MKVTWIVHANILERLTRNRDGLPQVIKDSGHRCITVDWEMGQLSPQVKMDHEGPVVLFGSHPFIRAINPNGRFQPGQLGVNQNTQVSSYMSNLPLDWFMNQRGIFMTWAMFTHRAVEIFQEQNATRLFIRPNSGFKTFAGQTVGLETIDLDIKSLDQLSGVMPETMIFIAPTQNILGEFRFVIADGQVLTGTEYRWDGKLDIRRDWPPECEALAQKVASHPWQVDIAYTCDVALLESGPQLVELNGFSCAGLYAADLNPIVLGVSNAALKEWRGDDIS